MNQGPSGWTAEILLTAPTKPTMNERVQISDKDLRKIVSGLPVNLIFDSLK